MHNMACELELRNGSLILSDSIVDELEALHIANLHEEVVAELLLGYLGNQAGQLPLALTFMQL